jgi:hypothetical protein
MTTAIFLLGVPLMILCWWLIVSSENRNRPKSKRKELVRKMMNADHLIFHKNGAISVDVEKMLRHPKVQDDLKAFSRLYMRETIMALWQGKRPPHSVGKYGTLTKKKLIIEWNDEWQEEMDKLSEYYDISYDILFDIPKEHPPVTILLTADEILEQYGREKEES